MLGNITLKTVRFGQVRPGSVKFVPTEFGLSELGFESGKSNNWVKL